MQMQRITPTALTALTVGTVLTVLTGAAGAQSTLYVDEDAPNDPFPNNPFFSDPVEDGSLQHPFDRIQEAIDNAIDGDEIAIQPGTYHEFSTIDVSSGFGANKSLWIHSTQGAAVTIVDASPLGMQVMRHERRDTGDGHRRADAARWRRLR